MVDDGGSVVAVLDWEICTLGDPLADLGLLQVYWTGPGDTASAWTGNATAAPGFWDRRQLAERYAEVSGRSIEHLDFYVAFAYWKLACILEGVYSRYLGGALGERSAAELAPFKMQVESAASESERYMEQLSERPVRVARRRADAPRTGAGRRPHRMDRAAAGAPPRPPWSRPNVDRTVGALRRRHVHRLPGPPTHDGDP